MSTKKQVTRVPMTDAQVDAVDRQRGKRSRAAFIRKLLHQHVSGFPDNMPSHGGARTKNEEGED